MCATALSVSARPGPWPARSFLSEIRCGQTFAASLVCPEFLALIVGHIVVRASFGSIRATSASFSCRVELTSRLDVRVICPSRSPVARSTASLGRVLWGECPASPVPSADSDSSRSLPPRFVAFARRYHRSRPSSLPPVGTLPGGLGCFYRGARAAFTLGGENEPSQVPARPLRTCPALRPRRSTHLRPFTMSAMLPSAHLTTSAPHTSSLSRLHHAACTPPVYASQPGSLPDHATLGSGGWPAFAGSGLSPDGSLQKVSVT